MGAVGSVARMTNADERQRLATILSERALFRESVVLSSGRRSDYYVDVRQVLLDPEGAYLAGRMAYPMLQPQSPQAVGGLTLFTWRLRRVAP